MGSEIQCVTAPVIEVKAIGTASLREVEIVKYGRVVHQVQPNAESAEFTWRDPDYQVGKTAYYYLKAIQADHQEAWSRPVWVDG